MSKAKLLSVDSIPTGAVVISITEAKGKKVVSIVDLETLKSQLNEAKKALNGDLTVEVRKHIEKQVVEFEAAISSVVGYLRYTREEEGGQNLYLQNLDGTIIKIASIFKDVNIEAGYVLPESIIKNLEGLTVKQQEQQLNKGVDNLVSNTLQIDKHSKIEKVAKHNRKIYENRLLDDLLKIVKEDYTDIQKNAGSLYKGINPAYVSVQSRLREAEATVPDGFEKGTIKIIKGIEGALLVGNGIPFHAFTETLKDLDLWFKFKDNLGASDMTSNKHFKKVIEDLQLLKDFIKEYRQDKKLILKDIRNAVVNLSITHNDSEGATISTHFYEVLQNKDIGTSKIITKFRDIVIPALKTADYKPFSAK